MGKKKKTNIELPSNLERKINKSLEKIKTEGGKKILEDLKMEYNNVIRTFYHHYTPSSYKRTYSTFMANNLYNIDNYNKYIKKNNDGFKIKFQISSDFIQQKMYNTDIHSFVQSFIDNQNSQGPYKADTNWVFKRTFEEGIHGYTDPWNSIILGSGNSMYGLHSIPKMMPSPKTIFDKRYKIYKAASNLRITLKPIVDKQLLEVFK